MLSAVLTHFELHLITPWVERVGYCRGCLLLPADKQAEEPRTHKTSASERDETESVKQRNRAKSKSTPYPRTGSTMSNNPLLGERVCLGAIIGNSVGCCPDKDLKIWIAVDASALQAQTMT